MTLLVIGILTVALGIGLRSKVVTTFGIVLAGIGIITLGG